MEIYYFILENLRPSTIPAYHDSARGHNRLLSHLNYKFLSGFETMFPIVRFKTIDIE